MKLPDSITGPAMALHSLTVLTGVALGAIVRELAGWTVAEARFWMRRSQVRRDIATMNSEHVR